MASPFFGGIIRPLKAGCDPPEGNLSLIMTHGPPISAHHLHCNAGFVAPAKVSW